MVRIHRWYSISSARAQKTPTLFGLSNQLFRKKEIKFPALVIKRDDFERTSQQCCRFLNRWYFRWYFRKPLCFMISAGTDCTAGLLDTCISPSLLASRFSLSPFKSSGRRRGTVVFFLGAIGLNWGGFLSWFWSPSTKSYIRTLSIRIPASYSSSPADSRKVILQPVENHGLFSHQTLQSIILVQKVMPATKNGILARMGAFQTQTSFLFQLKTLAPCRFSLRKYQQGGFQVKTVLLRKLGESQILHFENTARLFLFSRQLTRANFLLPFKISLFSNSQSKNSN